MLAELWRTIRNVLIGLGVLLGFFAVLEVLRAYETLAALHPVFGALFLLVLAACAAWLTASYVLSLRRQPVVLTPPPRPAPGSDDARAWRTYARFLSRVMSRVGPSAPFRPELRDRIANRADALAMALAAPRDLPALRAAVNAAEKDAVEPAMAVLDQLAEREVRGCVRDVMLGVTLSPWRSTDLLIVLYRTLAMVTRIVRVYSSRPRLREQFAILRDVLAVVATVNFLNYGSKLLQNLTASVPLLGRFTDDLAQGVGAGLLTSVAGHAALERCRSFQGWDRLAAQASVGGKLRGFMVDIKGIVADELVPRLKRPLESQLPAETAARPGFQDRLREGISRAIDETTDMMDTFLRRPAVAAGRGVVATGWFVGDTLWSTAEGAWNLLKAGGRFARGSAAATGRWMQHAATRKHGAAESDPANDDDLNQAPPFV